MEQWKMLQKKNKKMELIGIISVILCLIIGTVCDWNVLVNKNILIPVDDIQSFSLTILQIQATIGTLIFTIIALITGSISDSYMGISISDFYLSIKPWKLTQKKLIIISLGLCLAGVIFHSLGLYNVVFYLFIATLVVVLISINEIYSAFKGKYKQNDEIETYINYMLESNIEFGKKLNVFQNFVLDWENVVDSQNQKSYDKFLEIFEKGMSAIWDYRTDEALSAIEQQCYSVSYCLLKSDKKMLQEYGIEFVQEIYDRLWSFILNGIEKKESILNEYKSGFPFFKEIYGELIQSIDEMTVEDVEKRFKFANLVDLVLRISIWFSYKEDNEDEEKKEKMRYRRYQYNYQNDVSELSFFARYMGVYLRKQNNKNNIVNQEFWANVLNSWSSFSTYNIPEERVEDFLKTVVNSYFSYCYGMLVNGQENILKIGLYLKRMGNIFKLDNKYEVLLYLSVHCYIYYLAIRETDDCVSNDIRQSALNLWKDEEVRNAFKNFLNILSENPEWLELEVLNQMHDVLKRFEMFPQYRSSKCMIIEPVTSDFYLFIVLFMSHEYLLPGILEKNIDDMLVFRYVSDGMGDKTIELFSELYQAISVENKSEELIDKEVGLMYSDFEKMAKKKQKEKYIRLAKEEQKNYELKINEEEICKMIKANVIKDICEKFAPILVEEDEKNESIKVDLLRLYEYTKSVSVNDRINGHYSHINGNFLIGIEKFLIQEKAVDYKRRFKDFSDDMDFVKYLEEQQLYLLLGSPYIFKNKDYMVSAKYEKLLDDYETIYTVSSNGIALKRNSIQVCLHDVDVTIHPSNIQEEKVEYNEEDGKYKYAIVNGIPIDFDKDELSEFLYNSRKIINITAYISIQINEELCGTIFTGEI